jgi:hypothetical protein
MFSTPRHMPWGHSWRRSRSGCWQQSGKWEIPSHLHTQCRPLLLNWGGTWLLFTIQLVCCHRRSIYGISEVTMFQSYSEQNAMTIQADIQPKSNYKVSSYDIDCLQNKSENRNLSKGSRWLLYAAIKYTSLWTCKQSSVFALTCPVREHWARVGLAVVFGTHSI